jgi:hypothetical protein
MLRLDVATPEAAASLFPETGPVVPAEKRFAATTDCPAALNLLRALKELTEALGVLEGGSSGSFSAGGGGGPSMRERKEVESLLFSGWGGRCEA